MKLNNIFYLLIAALSINTAYASAKANVANEIGKAIRKANEEGTINTNDPECVLFLLIAGCFLGVLYLVFKD